MTMTAVLACFAQRRPRTLAAVLALAAAAGPAQAGAWAPQRTLDGPMAVSSPPEAPRVVTEPTGRALMTWATAGSVRWAEKRPGGAWTRAATAPGGGATSGVLAAALGPNQGAALAWTTVATRYTPSRLLVSLRAPGGRFAAPVEVGSFTAAGLLKLGIDCRGSVTLAWQGPQGLAASTWAGDGGSGACDGRPGPGPWSPPVALAPPGAAWPELAVAADGTAVLAWQVGTEVRAARRDDGLWGAVTTVSQPSSAAAWGTQVVLDGQGRAAVAWLDGPTARVARGDAAGWQPPAAVSGSHAVQALALAGTAAGDLLLAWQGIDTGGTGSAVAVWQRSLSAGGAWSDPTRLSSPSESPGAPSAAWAADGSVAVVGWVDEASNSARASLRSGAGWVRSTLGVGWWGNTVPVGAGTASAVAGWVVPTAGNPNAASIVARHWQ